MLRTVRRPPPAFFRAALAFMLATAALMVLFTNGLRLLAATPFTPGNVVIYRVGTGAGPLANTGNDVFLDEYTPGGTLVQSVPLPTTSAGANRRLIASGTATSEGLLTRSVDGLYLVLAGYDAAIPTAGLAGSTATAVPRVVGRVDAGGNIDTSTGLTDWASGNNPRGAASSNGTDLWVGGAAGGVRYTTLGSSTSTQLSTTVTNIRGVEIFDGQLYVSDSSGTAVRVGAVGSGLPTTSGQTITNVPGVPAATGSPYGFFFADLDATVPGVDTLYVADDGAGLIKYSLVGGSWTANGTVGGFADAYRGLTGAVSGTTVTLYSTRKGGSGATGGGELVVLTDGSGYNGAFTAVPALIAAAAANTAFRGVALSPAPLAITSQPLSQAIGTGATATLTVGATGLGPFSYQWYAGNSGDTSNAVGGATGASFTTPPLVTTTSYWVRVSNSFGHADSDTATITVQAVAPPTITAQPTSQTITSGATATLSVTASGGAPLNYRWYVGSSANTMNPIDGATAATFTTPALLSTTSYWVQVTNAGGFANSQTATITINAPACSLPHIPIGSVQGDGTTTPFNNQTVTVQGVVVGDYEGPSPALRGFYMQNLPADDDHNPATSEGIFVFEPDNANRVALGQVVQVTGTALEFNDQTEIQASTVEYCGATAAVVPVDVTLPVPPAVNGVPYLERFEGMLVRFHQTLYVTEHFQLGQFGQIVMSSGGRLPQPTNIVSPGAPAASQQAANDLNRIIVDDELNNQDPDPIRFGRGGNPLSAGNTLRGGDSATDVVGVLTNTFSGFASSGNAYRLRPTNALGGGVPNFQATNPRPSAPPGVGGRLKVAGMNVLNYFLTLDNGQSICGPIGSKQQCRGAQSATERTRQQAKLNQALVKIDGDVVGMSELENTQDAQGNDVNPPADIVARLNASLNGNVYSYIDTGVIGTDTVRVGLIYKPTAVTPIGPPMVDLNPVHNRPPVAQRFSENATGERFTVIVNHFKSKSCATNPANPLDNDQGDGQGCFNASRVQQAQALVSFITDTVLPAAGDPDVMLVGDFNAYAKEDPIRTIEQAGFTNLVARFSGAAAYSYVFNGQWGYIDQALVSTGLLAQVTGATDYHIDADEPSVLDYNTNFKDAAQILSLYNADEFRIADHDPVLIGLALQPVPHANADTYIAEAGATRVVAAAQGLLANDTGGPLTIFSYSNPAHGTLALNADGSFNYTAAAGFTGSDSFTYTVSNAVPRYDVQVFSTNLPPLATIGGVTLTAGGFGSSLAPVPGSVDEFYGLTDRGPNVDGPNGTKVEPLPGFTPSIGRFRLVGDQAVLEQVIPLQAADGTPYSGRVSTEANTGETITDLNGIVLPPDPNGYDSEGLVALSDGTFWVSDEYGPFITHFDATGRQIGRLSPFDGSLPPELAKRMPNRGMEGLTVTPDGTMLVGMMQSALQQDDLNGFDSKKLTPLRIVTHRLADGDTHEYLYLLDNPNVTKTAVSEITAITNTMFLVDERDGNFPPGAYKKLYLIDLTGATDVGPGSSVAGAIYDGAHGGLRIGGKTIELLLENLDTAASAATLAAGNIVPVGKGLYLDVGALLTSIDLQGRFFSHDKLEGVAALNGGATIVISNDSDFGIDGLVNSTPPFQLHAKNTPAGVQDDGEFLLIDLVRSTATVTINTSDTVAPDTVLISTPPALTNATAAAFAFSGSDAGSGVASFDCRLDGSAFAACGNGTAIYNGLADGGHAFSVRAIDGAGNVDATPASFAWTVDTTPPSFTMPRNQTLEATGPAGAVAIFTLPATAADAVDGSAPVSCSGGTSGSIFPLGTTIVTCVSMDHAGNSTSQSFTVTVRDTTPPAIDPHADVSVNATGAGGAIVTYLPPATHDVVDGAGTAVCSPASGTLFAPGQTPVTCTASDHAHNAAMPTTFSVVVIAAPSPVGRFVAFSRDMTWLRAGSTVVTGDVGANERRFGGHGHDRDDDDGDRDDVTVRIGEGATMRQASSRVIGDTVLLLNRSSVYNVEDNFLLNKRGTVLGTKTSPMAVPFTALPAFPAVTPGTQNVTVARNKTATLGPGHYGDVHVSAGGTLVLTGGRYQMRSLDLDRSATVLFRAATEIRVKTELDSAANAKLILDASVPGLKASQMVIYVEGRNEICHHVEADDDGDDAGPASVHIGAGNIVQANIYAASGTVWLKSRTQATGAFIGVHVRIGADVKLALDSAFR